MAQVPDTKAKLPSSPRPSVSSHAPHAPAAARRRIFDEHLRYHVGLLADLLVKLDSLPDGDGGFRAMRNALRDAGLTVTTCRFAEYGRQLFPAFAAHALPGFADKKVTVKLEGQTRIGLLKELAEEYGFSAVETGKNEVLIIPAPDEGPVNVNEPISP